MSVAAWRALLVIVAVEIALIVTGLTLLGVIRW